MIHNTKEKSRKKTIVNLEFTPCNKTKNKIGTFPSQRNDRILNEFSPTVDTNG